MAVGACVNAMAFSVGGIGGGSRLRFCLGIQLLGRHICKTKLMLESICQLVALFNDVFPLQTTPLYSHIRMKFLEIRHHAKVYSR